MAFKLDVDLNLANYTLEDILGLFHLDFNYTSDDLRRAKKVVLQTHPDKAAQSGTTQEHFLFFAKAYRILLDVYQFRYRHQASNLQDYKIIAEEHTDSHAQRTALLKQFETADGRQNTAKFNKVFNELFEKYRVQTDDTANGYGDWLKSDDGLLFPPDHTTTVGEMHKQIDAKKRELKALVPVRDPAALLGNPTSGTDLHGNAPTYYESGALFSNGGLLYDDLQRVYQTENVIPVTADDLANRPKYKTVDDLVQARSVGCRPLSEAEARAHLAEQKASEDRSGTERAFAVAQYCERGKKATADFVSAFRQLTFR